jgi:hypothetical protein
MKSVHRELRAASMQDLPLLQLAALKGVDINPLEGDERILGWAETAKGYLPIAIIDIKRTPYVVEPHVSWMPWASARDISEGFKWFIRQFKEAIFITAVKKNCGFYELMVTRAILRKVGVLEVKQSSEEIHFYQRIDNE